MTMHAVYLADLAQLYAYNSLSQYSQLRSCFRACRMILNIDKMIGVGQYVCADDVVLLHLHKISSKSFLSLSPFLLLLLLSFPLAELETSVACK